MNPLLLALLLAQNTPNMSLCTVNPGVDSLVTTQNCMNQNANTIDAHNHSSGEGTPVPVAGINIQASVPFNGYPVSGCGYLSAVDAGAGPSLVRTLWNDGIDWWVEDGSGNKIKLTSGGAINVVLGDGGSYTFQNITVVTKATIGSTSISGTCLYGPYGAYYCFDASGNLTEGTSDAGTGVTIGDYAGDAIYLLNGTATMNSGGIGGGWFCGLSGCAVQFVDTIGLDSSFNGFLAEQGTNVLLGVPDGGSFEVNTGRSGGYPLLLEADGGVVFRVSNLGSVDIGDVVSSNNKPRDGFSITTTADGGNKAGIYASGIDTNIDFDLAAAGDAGIVFLGGPFGTMVEARIDNLGGLTLDAGIYIQGHIDFTGPKPSIATSRSAPLTGCFDAGAPTLSANSTDSAGVISLTTGSLAAGGCAGTVDIGDITFTGALSATRVACVVTPDITTTGAGSTIGILPTVALQSYGFSVYTSGITQTPAASTTYSWDYACFGLH